MYHSYRVGLVVLLVFVAVSGLEARPWRPNQIPNGARLGCAACHVSSAGGGARNAFGSAVEEVVSPGSQAAFWSATLARLDSDGDGASNGLELQDPNGTWRPGQAAPGTASLVTNPGDRNSTPAPTNRAPAFGSIPEQKVQEGVALSFKVQATDQDNDTLTYSASDLPAGASFQNQTFTWTPGFDQGGQSYNVQFTVSDGTVQTSLTVKVTVENVNRPLAIQSFTPTRGVVLAASGDTLRFSVAASDPDGDAVSYAWTFNGVAQTETGASLLVTVSDASGDDRVSVSVSSGGDPLSQAWTIVKTLRGDFTGDGRVNLADFIAFARVFNKREGDPEFDARFDLSGNGVVDFADFVSFVKFFGLP